MEIPKQPRLARRAIHSNSSPVSGQRQRRGSNHVLICGFILFGNYSSGTFASLQGIREGSGGIRSANADRTTLSEKNLSPKIAASAQPTMQG